MRPGDIDVVCRILKKEFGKHRMPVIDLIQLQENDPFKVLIATILSARTRDQTTTEAARRLFKFAAKPSDLASMSVKEIERLIFPVGFYQNKARFLHDLPDELDRLFGGRIPDTVEELIQLPGVGRKTANLVVAVGFNKPAICVDVHVHRITNRLGYLKTRTPLETEMTLRRILPQKHWITFNSSLVSFGQHTCLPLNPRCDGCPLLGYCDRVGGYDKVRS
jgi:endonuclease III